MAIENNTAIHFFFFDKVFSKVNRWLYDRKNVRVKNDGEKPHLDEKQIWELDFELEISLGTILKRMEQEMTEKRF